jgi:ribosome maturation factor RimP
LKEIGDKKVPYFIEYMTVKDQILVLLTEDFFAKDYFLVELNLSKSNKIDLYFDSMTGIKIEDCINLSRIIEEKLGSALDDYELNVSSPGAGQPFKVAQQYDKYLSKKVEVILKDGKKMMGILIGHSTEETSIEIEKKIKEQNKKKIVKEVLIIKNTDIKTTQAIISFK